MSAFLTFTIKAGLSRNGLGDHRLRPQLVCSVLRPDRTILSLPSTKVGRSKFRRQAFMADLSLLPIDPETSAEGGGLQFPTNPHIIRDLALIYMSLEIILPCLIDTPSSG